MQKIDVMGEYWGTPLGKLQVIFLYHIGKTIDEIAAITRYARSTISNYIRKFDSLLQDALATFFYNNVEDKISTDSGVVWMCEVADNETPTAYVCEIYDKEEKFLFLKIGYSKRMQDRMYSHAHSSRYKSGKCIVKEYYIFDTEEQALSMENLLRKYYKEKNDCLDFIRNDRFCEQTPCEEDFKIFREKADFIRENF